MCSVRNLLLERTASKPRRTHSVADRWIIEQAGSDVNRTRRRAPGQSQLSLWAASGVTHCRQVWRLPTPLWGVPSLDVRGLLRPPIRTWDR